MKTTYFKFIKYTWLWFLISSIVLLIGIGAMVTNKVKYGQFMQLGIDFKGGTLMELKFEKANDNQTELLRNAINTAAGENAVSQISTTDQDSYIIQAKSLSSQEYDAVMASVKKNLGSYEQIRFTTIGPSIGETMKRKAIIAVIIACIAIMLYIAYAFRRVPKRVSPWRFGICALIALSHDILATIGFIALLGYEVDALFITAILTILGFSIHDTIVVFDRIRENLKSQGRDDSFGQIVDISLNQTLSRSINTTLSTLFTLTALYIFGAESIKVFVLTLIFGFIIGTYSSIFIASPILTLWQEKSRVR